MDIEKLIEPASPWTVGRWLDRVDEAASFLFLHDYITGRQREAITRKLEAQIRKGIEQGRIVASGERSKRRELWKARNRKESS